MALLCANRCWQAINTFRVGLPRARNYVNMSKSKTIKPRVLAEVWHWRESRNYVNMSKSKTIKPRVLAEVWHWRESITICVVLLTCFKTHHCIFFFVRPLHSKLEMECFCRPSADLLSWQAYPSHLVLSDLTTRPLVWPWHQVCLTKCKNGRGANNINIHYDVTGLLTVVWRSLAREEGGSVLIEHMRDT